MVQNEAAKNKLEIELENKTILITGTAGFIGASLAETILNNTDKVKLIGIDNINNYYDVSLKQYRLSKIKDRKNYSFVQGNIADKEMINSLFDKYRPALVINLAAQAGVRYSIINPEAYIESNITGFFNILEACRHYPVEHLVYASSSSVYGSNKRPAAAWTSPRASSSPWSPLPPSGRPPSCDPMSRGPSGPATAGRRSPRRWCRSCPT